ncbi:MAG: TonB-dependent receptor, partial [Bacteroidales bacterium]
LVSYIEENYNYTFFFKKEWVDNIKINQTPDNNLLSEILSNTFNNTDIRFYLINDNIILTKNYIINTNIIEVYDTVQLSDIQEDKSIEHKISKSVSPESILSESLQDIIKIGNPVLKEEKGLATITGFIKEELTGEPVIGCVVYIDDLQKGVITDVSGYYIISVPKGEHQITIHSMGKEDVTKEIIVYSDGSLNIRMEEKLIQLSGVVIKADRYHNVGGVQLGMDKLEIKTIKQIPASLGEADIMKSAILLPGVQTVGEGASGFNVRGGNTDQNLILLNGAPVFNTSHLFGFFSAFNPDVIKDFKLYKSWIPAKYGGRLSSVFNIDTKSGNRKKLAGNLGISPVTGKLTVEGPIVKNKSSFIIGGRTTYSDWILRRLKKADIRNSRASFYDIVGKIAYDINDRNMFDISAYLSSDYFKFNTNTEYNYKNRNLCTHLKHIFTNKLILDLSGIYSHYSYSIYENESELEKSNLTYDIKYGEIKADFNYFLNSSNKINFGLNSGLYRLNPGSYLPEGKESLIIPVRMENEKANETALYISDEYDLSQKISLYAGFRYSVFALLGPRTVYNYAGGIPRNTSYIEDTAFYSKNRIIKTYSGPELRLSLRYRLNTNNSVKLGYNSMRQYLHMLSNTTSISPTDTWKLSDKYISPQTGNQISLGYYKNFLSGNIETSAEVYYKKIRNLIEYKGGAELLLNETIETDLIKASGKAYGVELMVKRNTGRFNGWLSYTYSRILVKADSQFEESKINSGKYFPANFDKPHDLTCVANYKFSRRLNMSGNFTYSTGRPITFPVAIYNINNFRLLHYTDRNEYRIPDYLRLDFSVNVEGNLKSKKIAHSSWSFSVYNVTGRKNVYSIYFISKAGRVNGYKLSIFGQPVYTISYSIKF